MKRLARLAARAQGLVAHQRLQQPVLEELEAAHEEHPHHAGGEALQAAALQIPIDRPDERGDPIGPSLGAVVRAGDEAANSLFAAPQSLEGAMISWLCPSPT
mgnify:CR=1 FL=1